MAQRRMAVTVSRSPLKTECSCLHGGVIGNGCTQNYLALWTVPALVHDVRVWVHILGHPQSVQLSEECYVQQRGGILPCFCRFPWNRNWNPWLIAIISTTKNRQKQKNKNRKQSESVFGLSAFCCSLKLFPNVRGARCIVVLAFKNGHTNRHHHSWKKFWWNRNEEWLEVAMGRKKDRRWKHRSVYSKNMKLCVMILSFSVHFLKWN